MRSRFLSDEIARGVDFGIVKCDRCGVRSDASSLNLLHLSASTAYYFTLCDDCLDTADDIDETYDIVRDWADDTADDIDEAYDIVRDWADDKAD